MILALAAFIVGLLPRRRSGESVREVAMGGGVPLLAGTPEQVFVDRGGERLGLLREGLKLGKRGVGCRKIFVRGGVSAWDVVRESFSHVRRKLGWRPLAHASSFGGGGWNGDFSAFSNLS